MTCHLAARVRALQLVAKRNAGQTEIMNLLRDAWRDAAPNPDKAPVLVGQIAKQLLAIEIRQNCRKLFDHLVTIEYESGISKDRRSFEIGCEQAPVAVD